MPSDQEWAIQQTSHIYMINDLASEIKTNKKTFNAPKGFNIQLDNAKIENTGDNFGIKYFSVIEPSSTHLLYWNLFMSMLIILYIYLIFLNMYFTKNEGDLDWFWNYWNEGYPRWLHYLFTIYLTIDLIIEMHVAFYEKGSYVTDKRKVFNQYIKNGFIFDIIPLIVLYSVHLIPQARVSSVFRYLFFLKFYQLTTINQRLMDRLQLHRKSKAAYQILKMGLELLIIVQIFASVFFRVGIHMMDLINNQGYDDWDSWLLSDNLFGDIYEKSIFQQYFLSIYWSFSTLTIVSYGDITPMNPPEIMVASGAMVAAIFIFAFNIQTIYDVYNEYNETKKKFQKYLTSINRFMRYQNVSLPLQNKIRKYLDHIWDKQRAREQEIERQIIDSLAPQLKQELMFEAYGKELLKIPWIINNFSFEFIQALAQDINELYYSPDEIIFKDKAMNNDDCDLYILQQGQVELFVPSDTKDPTLISTLNEGSLFGQYAFLTGDARKCSALCTTYSKVYQIKRSKFLKRLEKYEHDYQRYCYLRDQVMLGHKNEILNLKCYTCNMTDHMASECPLTHYTKNILLVDQASKILKDSKAEQNRRKFKRRKYKRFKKFISQNEINDDEFEKYEQYYQDKQIESFNVDRVQSYQFYYPLNNIERMHQKVYPV